MSGKISSKLWLFLFSSPWPQMDAQLLTREGQHGKHAAFSLSWEAVRLARMGEYQGWSPAFHPGIPAEASWMDTGLAHRLGLFLFDSPHYERPLDLAGGNSLPPHTTTSTPTPCKSVPATCPLNLVNTEFCSWRRLSCGFYRWEDGCAESGRLPPATAFSRQPPLSYSPDGALPVNPTSPYVHILSTSAL